MGFYGIGSIPLGTDFANMTMPPCLQPLVKGPEAVRTRVTIRNLDFSRTEEAGVLAPVEEQVVAVLAKAAGTPQANVRGVEVGAGSVIVTADVMNGDTLMSGSTATAGAITNAVEGIVNIAKGKREAGRGFRCCRDHRGFLHGAERHRARRGGEPHARAADDEEGPREGSSRSGQGNPSARDGHPGGAAPRFEGARGGTEAEGRHGHHGHPHAREEGSVPVEGTAGALRSGGARVYRPIELPDCLSGAGRVTSSVSSAPRSEHCNCSIWSASPRRSRCAPLCFFSKLAADSAAFSQLFERARLVSSFCA